MAEYKGKYKSVYLPGIEFETDYIAREAARDLMYHNQGPLTEYDLNDIPPADVRPVDGGLWLRIGNTGLASCKCGFITDRYSTYRFCPSCGRKNGGAEYGG